jgi:hypothetical protein
MSVSQAVINSPEADKGISINGHEKIFSKNNENFFTAQKDCAVAPQF